MNGYYGWRIVAISLLALTIAIGATIHAFGLFVLPVSAEFHLSRADMNSSLILVNFGMACAAPLIGWTLDRQSSRRIMSVSAVLFGGSLGLLGMSHDIRMSAIVLAVPMAAAIVGIGTLTSTTLVARWFAIHRGRAMAIAAIGISLGPIVIVPAIGRSIAALGWRQSLMIEGGAVTLLLLLLASFVREKRAEDVEPGGTVRANVLHNVPGQVRLTLGGLLKLPAFWLITVGAGIGMGIQQTILISLVPLAQESGLSITQSAGLMSVYGLTAISGKLLLAWQADRYDRTRLLAGLCSVIALSSAALLLSSGHAWLLFSSALLGLAAGATTPSYLALLADRLGPASFGTANGAGTFVTTMMAALLIRIGGETYDRTGSYHWMFSSFAIVGLASALLILASATRPRDGKAAILGSAG
jgi:MFS family permease